MTYKFNPNQDLDASLDVPLVQLTRRLYATARIAQSPDAIELAEKAFDFACRMQAKLVYYVGRYSPLARKVADPIDAVINPHHVASRDVICNALRRLYVIFKSLDNDKGVELAKRAFRFAKGLDRRLQYYKRKFEPGSGPAIKDGHPDADDYDVALASAGGADRL